MHGEEVFMDGSFPSLKASTQAKHFSNELNMHETRKPLKQLQNLPLTSAPSTKRKPTEELARCSEAPKKTKLQTTSISLTCPESPFESEKENLPNGQPPDEDDGYFVESPATLRESLIQCYDIAWLKRREKTYQPKFYYLNWHPNLDPLMRAILLDWIYEVAVEYQLNRETVHIAINIVDRFMSVIPDLPKDRFQLIGVTALFMASKLEEVEALQAREMVLVCDNAYSLEQLFHTEKLIAEHLEWNLLPLTPSTWLKVYMSLYLEKKTEKNGKTEEFPKKEFFRLNQWIDYCSVDYGYLKFLPSELAAAVFCTYCKDSALIEEITGLKLPELEACVQFIRYYEGISVGKQYMVSVEFLEKEFHEKPYRNDKLLATVKQRLKAEDFKRPQPFQLPL